MAKEEPRTEVIVLLGNKGAGKTTFVSIATPESKPTWKRRILHTLTGGNGDIKSASYHHDDNSTVLVDTPGFDTSLHSDRDIVFRITKWLDKNYKKKEILVGVVYLHQISDRRLPEDPGPLQTLRTFLESPEIKRRIGGTVMATSMWSNMMSEKSKDLAESRERQLKERWSAMMQSLELVPVDSGVMRFEESSVSVENIIRSLRVTR